MIDGQLSWIDWMTDGWILKYQQSRMLIILDHPNLFDEMICMDLANL